MKSYHILFIASITIQPLVVSAAESPVYDAPRALRNPRVISGAWHMHNSLTTHFTKTNPIAIPPMPPAKEIVPNTSPDSPHKIITPGVIVSNKRKANNTPVARTPKKSRRNKNRAPLPPATLEAPALNVDDASDSASLPPSPIKPGREQATLYEERDFTAKETFLICQAIRKERQAIQEFMIKKLEKKRDRKQSAQRILDELTQETKNFFKKLDQKVPHFFISPDIKDIPKKYEAELQSLAAATQAFEEAYPLDQQEEAQSLAIPNEEDFVFALPVLPKKHTVELQSLAADIQNFEESYPL